jgi:hypothetical protein
VGHRVGPTPRPEVGHNLVAAVGVDPIKAGRLVRIAVAAASTDDEGVELVAQDCHI